MLKIGMLQHSPLRELLGMGDFVYSFKGSLQVSKSSTYISIVFDHIPSGKVIEKKLKRLIHWPYLISIIP